MIHACPELVEGGQYRLEPVRATPRTRSGALLERTSRSPAKAGARADLIAAK